MFHSETDDKQKGDEIDFIKDDVHGAAACNHLMRTMFVRLMFSQTVAEKLLEDQEKHSSETLASLSDDNIVSICDVI